MQRFQDDTLLVVAPHPDDEVFGCGGLIHRVKKDGGKVFVLFLTVGTTQDFSQNGISTRDERVEEIRRVAKLLGYDDWRIAFDGNQYHLRLDTVPQRDIIHEIERGNGVSLEAIKPTIICAPPPNDYNQDHRAASGAVISAMRPTSPTHKYLPRMVLHYEIPPNAWAIGNNAFAPNWHVTLGRTDLEAKLNALARYKSQLKDTEGPLSLRAVKILALTRGMQVGVGAAESYVAKRVIV